MIKYQKKMEEINMMRKWLGWLSLLLILSISVIAFAQDELPNVIQFEKLKHQKYLIREEKDGATIEGHLAVDVTPQDAGVFQVVVDFQLGDNEFSNTFTATKDDSQNVFNNLFFANPMTMAVIAPVMAVQFMLLPVTLMGGELKEGFKWSTKEEGEKMTIQVTSSEERFGAKANWIEILKNDQIIVRMLLSKASPLPFVVEIRDTDTLEEGQKSLYLELQEWEMN